ncbi:MAG: DegT/DnrJ/EryC1/StrS family aminotransferase [Nanoarchaeota archaeon]
MIPIFRPSVGQEELDAIAETFKSGWIGLGPKTKEFEEAFAKYIGTKYALGMNSATAALHLALAAHNITSGEVIVPTLTFVSTAHAAKYNNADVVFADADPETLCINIEDIKKKITPNTKAILPVHLAGHPCDMDLINEIAEEKDIIVIEDAANATGAKYKGKRCGALAKAGCFSFHAIKNMTTGEGGMVTTDDEDIYKRLMRLRWVGINKDTWARQYTDANYSWYYEVTELGWKYHLSDIPASMGLVQLKKCDALNQARRNIVKQYNESFKDLDWIKVPVEQGDIEHAYWLYSMRVPAKKRNDLVAHLAKNEIASSVHFMPVHLHPYYKSLGTADVPIAEREWQRMITLPLFPSMTQEEIATVIKTVKSFDPD